jgi:hypothetical protein
VQRKAKTLALTAACFVLAGAGASAWWYQREHAPTEAAKEAIRATLKDPDSALFREVRFYSFTGATCGQFNAKNSMGGYVGYRKFVFTHTGKLSVQGDDYTIDEAETECVSTYAASK